MGITISGENNNDRILASDGVIDSLSGFNVVGVITATSFTGDLTGDVTGNLTGNVTGNINNSTLLLQTGGTERLRITSGGKISYNYDGSSASTVADVDIRTNSGVHIRGVDPNANNTNIYIGGAVANQRKTAIIHDPVDGYCRGDLHFCLENTADLSDVDITDSKMVIKADGKIGIAIDNPNGQFHIHQSSAGSVTAATDANDLVVESSANVGMSFLTAANSLARIKFGDPDATNAGAFVYNHQNDKLSIVTATGNRMIIGADMISSRTHYGVARTAGGYTFRETNEGNERAGMHSDASNNLIFKVGSASEKLRITSGGQLNLAGNMQFTAADPELEFNNGGPRFRVPAPNTLTIHTGGGLGATTNERLRIASNGAIKLNDNNIEPTGPGGNVTTAYNNAGWEKLVFDASYNDTARGPNKIILQNDPNGSGWYAGFGIASNELSIYSGGNIAFYRGFNNASQINQSLRITHTGQVNIGGQYTQSAHALSANKSDGSCIIMGNTSGTGSGSHDAQLVASHGSDFDNLKLTGHSVKIFTNVPSGLAETMRIDRDGYVTKAKHPAFFVTMNGGDQTTSQGNIMPFDTVVHNNGGHYKTSGSNIYRFVCPVDGYYFFGGQVWLKHGGGTGNHARWEIRRDTTVVALAGWHQNGVNLNDMQSSATVTIYCDAGAKVFMEADYALTYWRGNTSQPHTFFHGYLIG